MALLDAADAFGDLELSCKAAIVDGLLPWFFPCCIFWSYNCCWGALTAVILAGPVCFFFLFYFCFPTSFAAVCLSVWAFLQMLSPFTAVNPHKTILLVKGHQLPQLVNLFCLHIQRGRAAGKVPSGGRGKGGNVAMYYSPTCPCF